MYFKDSGIDWIGHIPNDWVVDRIKDVIPKVLGGGTPDSSEPEYWEDGDIIWITPTDFQDYKNELMITNSRRKITENGLKSCSATLLPAGTVLMASRATIGIAKIAGTELCTNQGFISFICDNFSNKYFYYLIKVYLGELFKNIASGTTFQEIGRTAAKIEHIAFPSIPKQRRIVDYLDKTCAAIDAAIEAKKKQLETLDALRKSIIHKAVTRGLDDSVELKDSGVEWIGKVPKHWRVEKLKRFLERPLMYGTNEAAELDDMGFPRYIRITDFDDNGSLRDDTFKSLPPDKAEGYYLVEGDVLFARSGATVGKSFLFNGYDGKACFAGYLIKAQANKHKLLPEYLYYFTKSPSYDSWKNVIFTQATIQNISATKYAYLPITVPPTTEQRRILEYLDSKMDMLLVLQENLSNQISALDQYRKSLIHECVTGKRRITEHDLKEIQVHV